MRRRSFLRVGLATGVLGTLGMGSTAAPSTSATASGGGSDLEPTGYVPVTSAYEVVPGDEGRFAYVAAKDGFAVLDVRDPASPTVVAERRGLQASHPDGPMEGLIDCKVDGDTLVVVGSGLPPRSADPLHGVLVYDVSDPENPRLRTFYGVENGIHNCFLRDDVAYLQSMSPTVALDVVDVSGSTVRKLGTWTMGTEFPQWRRVNASLRNVHDVWVQDGLAYCANWDAGTWILDVSDPANVETITRVGGASVSELSDLSVPEVQRRNMEPPGNAHYVTVDETGSTLFVGRETFDTRAGDGTGGPSGIDVYDLTADDGPRKTATIRPPSPSTAGGGPDAAHSGAAGSALTSHNFDVSDGYLYSSWYHGGVRVHDVSDPANPREIAHWRDPPSANFWTVQVARPGECVLGGSLGDWDVDGSGGVYVFPDPRSSGGGGDEDPKPPFTWNFRDGNRHGWSAVNVRHGDAQPRGGHWTGQARPDPRWVSPRFAVPAGTVSTVTFEMANQNPPSYDAGIVFFETGDDRGFVPTQGVRFDTHHDGVWREYTVDVGGHPEWAGRITRLRIDPIETAGGHPIGLRHVRLD